MTENSNIFKVTFDTPEGKQVVEHLVDYAKVFQTTFTGDPLTSAYNEGARSVVLHILQQLGQNDALEAVKQQNERKLAQWKTSNNPLLRQR